MINSFSQKAIKVERRFAEITLRLSTGNSYRSISKVFRVGKSTIIKIFQDGINANLQLTPIFVKLKDKKPTIGDGAKDGTHIEQLSPSSDSELDIFQEIHYQQANYCWLKLVALVPYRGKKSREKFSSGKNLVTSEKLVTFPRLIFQICHFSPTNF